MDTNEALAKIRVLANIYWRRRIEAEKKKTVSANSPHCLASAKYGDATMNLSADLNEINRHFANAFLRYFPANIQALQSNDGTLLFRGPNPLPLDSSHVGTHVAVSVDRDVRAALDNAIPSDRAEMMEILINSLGTQIEARYSPAKIGTNALNVVGSMRILRGA